MRMLAIRFRFLCVFLLFSLHPARAARAATFGRAESFVLPATQTLHDDLYAAGKIVDIEGTVDGDLVIGGQTVMIGGVVTGDVIVAARDITISGRVDGTIRGMGNNVTVSGTVGHDALAACGTMLIARNGSVGRDALAAAGTASFLGKIGRDVRVAAGTASFGGTVGGDVHARAKDVVLEEGAVLSHDLLYTSRNEVTRAAGAVVHGRVERHTPPEEEHRRPFGLGILRWIRGLFGFLIFGALLHFLVGRLPSRGATTLAASPLPSLGIGVLAAIALPCAAAVLLIVGILVGGWWIGVGALALYLFALAAGYLVAATWVGSMLLKRAAFGWALLLGLAVVGVVGAIPFVGGLVCSIATLFGLGALMLAWWGAWRASHPGAAPIT